METITVERNPSESQLKGLGVRMLVCLATMLGCIREEGAVPHPRDTPWLDSNEVSAIVFHPRRETEAPERSPACETLSIPVDPGIAVGGRFYPAGKDRPTLLFFHGNGEIVADYGDLAGEYVTMGVNFLPVDYRGYGRSTGCPTISSMLRDARTVFDYAGKWLSDHGYTNRIVVMGRSLGSASALELASAYPDKVAGLIVESGFADTLGLLRRLGATMPRESVADAVRQTEKIGAYKGPTLIIHGTADMIIPLADAEALHAASGSPDKTLLKIGGAGHNNLLAVGWQEYLAAVRALAGSHYDE